jgi:imidazolonepropionase-like amidohydrolase
MYEPINPSSGASFTRMAHERGFPVSSHWGYPLPIAASGIDSKEHALSFLGLGPRICGTLRDDMAQLSKEGGIGIVPTLSSAIRQLAMRNGSIVGEIQDSAFLSGLLGLYGFNTPVPAVAKRLEMEVHGGRANVARFHKAGARLATGTDSPFYWMPWGLHRELEEFVASGLSPLEAITAATLNAAIVLKAENEIGTIETGKLADLVILDESPLEDIRNTRRIWKVIQGGRIANREALEHWVEREAETIADIVR